MLLKIFLLFAFFNAQRWTRLAQVALKKARDINAESISLAVEMPTSNSARREAMRRAGIPTSQMPFQITENASGRQYQYLIQTRQGQRVYSVQHQKLDESHPGLIHWEVGKVRVDDEGKVILTRWKAPRLDNSKVKVVVSKNEA